MKKTYYLTTPIYYPSGNPHIGHCYTTVACDTIARFKRMQGYDVMFLTGTDEHGQKIELKAAEKGVTPKEYVDEIVANFKRLWETMHISYDRFIRTTDDYHIETVQKIFRKLYEKGYIYKGTYKGKYCTPCESFWTESQLVDGKCPDCGREVKEANEEAYFLRLSDFADKIEKFLTETDYLQPKSRVNEMVNNFIKPGLEDLCVSRTSFTWGIPVDFDSKHVVYVWVDALSNYISALGYGNEKYNDFEKYWPADMHMTAKEIVRFHSIVWPIILMMLDLPLPKHLYGHGWINFNGDKMSKSKGDFLTVSLLEEKGYAPLVYRMFCLQSHYRKPLTFSFESLDNTATAYKKLVSRIAALKNEGEHDEAAMEPLRASFRAALENDLNTSLALTALYDVLKAKLSDADKLALIKEFDEVLSLGLLKAAKALREEQNAQKSAVPEGMTAEEAAEIEALIAKRTEARKAKDWATADAIRDALAARHIVVKDTPQGITWSVQG